MLELVIQGRGGQGAQTAGTLLAGAFFEEGKEVQAFATYGGARRGTLVSSYIRVDDIPVRRRCDIETPDAVLCFDVHLLGQKLLNNISKDTPIVVNTSKAADSFRVLRDYNIYTIDAFRISHNNDLGRFINSTLLGAFTSVLNAPSIKIMSKIIADSAPVKQEENVNAFMDGYKFMQAIKNRNVNEIAV